MSKIKSSYLALAISCCLISSISSISSISHAAEQIASTSVAGLASTAKPASNADTKNSKGKRYLQLKQVQDAQGQSLDSSQRASAQAGHWVLLVLDARQASAAQYLQHLNPAQGQGISILLFGSEQQTQAVHAAHQHLQGVRWWFHRADVSVKEIGLSGSPMMLGMLADQSIAWQMSGVPESRDKAQAMIQTWLRMSAKTNANVAIAK